MALPDGERGPLRLCQSGRSQRLCAVPADVACGGDPHQPCLPGQWQCRNRVCIMAEWKCNGIDDCGDSSDEDVCGKRACWMLLSGARAVKATCEVGGTLPSWALAPLGMAASVPGTC
uniref:Uncharacterized protein n=1 Tax=Bubo bubo TaxID=30461 RepID=A0A8C0FB26_BUBBB